MFENMLLTYKIIQHVCPNTEYVKYQLLVIVQWWFNVRKKILTWILENFYLDSLLPSKTGYCYEGKIVFCLLQCGFGLDTQCNEFNKPPWISVKLTKRTRTLARIIVFMVCKQIKRRTVTVGELERQIERCTSSFNTTYKSISKIRFSRKLFKVINLSVFCFKKLWIFKKVTKILTGQFLYWYFSSNP